MAVIKGQNLRVFLNGACVAEATSCTINVTGELEDSSTKDSTASFQRRTLVRKSFTVSVDSLDVSAASLRNLLNIGIAGQKVTVKWDQTSGDMNRTARKAYFARQGQAFLTQLSLKAANRQTATNTIQFTGTGPITAAS